VLAQVRRIAGATLIGVLTWAGPQELRADPTNHEFTEAEEAAPVEAVMDPAIADAIRDALADPATLRQFIGVDPAPLQAFYGERVFAPVWLAPAGLAPHGLSLFQTIQRLHARGALDLGALPAAMAARAGSASPTALAELELLMSGALVAHAVDPDDILKPAADTRALAAVAGGETLALWLPPDPAFWRLRAAIGDYEQKAAAGGWPTVNPGPKLEPGVRDGRVVQVRQRLLASGDLMVTSSDPGLYDDALLEAVKRFQARHGLAVDGVIGHGTIDALNVAAELRLASMIFNLHDLYEQPRDWGDDYVMVNIAAAQMELVQGGVSTASYNVIVGRTDRRTPELDSAINRLEFNPYWNVPAGIYQKDFLPKLRKDPSYLTRQNIRVFRTAESPNEVDPNSVDWFSPEARQMRVRLRQDPGPENALGPAKFLFPNKYDVYLHGTNKPALFSKSARFLSSGCVRLPDPLGFAELLLKYDPQWTRARIDKAVKSGRNQGVALASPLPVHLVYDTAWVDAAGVVQFRTDVYGRDKPKTLVADRGGKKS
jgi:murein L,D-transpeptidase YcbB/YkuD